jgi:aliphatic sulfonates family ABC transporter substrate-binding protein
MSPSHQETAGPEMAQLPETSWRREMIATRALCSIVGTILALLYTAHGAAFAQTKRIPVNIGWQPGTCYACYVARDREIFQEVGLQPNYVKFTAGPPMFSALQSGSIDVSWSGTLPAVIGAAQGVPLNVIAIEGATRNALIVKANGPIKKVADLAGKNIGTVKGSGSYFVMTKLTEMHGIGDGYNYVNLQLPNVIPAFVKNDVDAVVLWEPWASRAVAEGGVRIADELDIFGKYPGNVILARTGWMESNPEAVQRYLKALHMAQEIYAKDPEIALKAMASEVSIDMDTARGIFSRDTKPTFKSQITAGDPSAIVGSDSAQVKIFQAIADFFFEKGFIKVRPSMANVVNSTPLVTYMKSADR